MAAESIPTLYKNNPQIHKSTSLSGDCECLTIASSTKKFIKREVRK